METCRLQCSCGTTVDYQNPMRGCHNVGHAMEETGWNCLFTPDGDSVWLCPICAHLAGMLARKLIDVVGTGLVRLDHVGGLNNGD